MKQIIIKLKDGVEITPLKDGVMFTFDDKYLNNKAIFLDMYFKDCETLTQSNGVFEVTTKNSLKYTTTKK